MTYNAVVERFYEVTTRSELEEFCEELDLQIPFNVAFRHRIMLWLKQNSQLHFNPRQFLSPDLSAIMYGRCPTIFLGSNDWALRRLLTEEELISKIDYFCYRMDFIRRNNKNKFCFVVVPEKDVVIDTLAGRNNLLAPMEKAIERLSDSCDMAAQPFVYNKFIKKLPAWSSEDEYDYADSHLLSRDYFLIFREIMLKLGFNPDDCIEEHAFKSEPHFGDLNEKFQEPVSNSARYFIPYINGVEATRVGGSETFESPLGGTYQLFYNENAKIKQKVAVFGDSHSSIGSQRRLTYMLSSVFRYCEFHWVPWGGAPEEFTSDADVVVLEIAQRFVFT